MIDEDLKKLLDETREEAWRTVLFGVLDYLESKHGVKEAIDIYIDMAKSGFLKDANVKF